MASDKLNVAINAIRAGNKLAALPILAEIARKEPTNEIAWLWLSICVDEVEKKKYCLSRVLATNPNNSDAREALAQLEPPRPTLDEILKEPVTTSPKFVTLNCPSCGGKLNVTNDMERFACKYCGNEYIVKRSNGSISLAPVVEILKRVESSADKTASRLSDIHTDMQSAASGLSDIRKGVDQAATELKIARLRNEIAALELEKERKFSNEKTNESIGSVFLLGVGGIAVGAVFGWSAATIFGIVMLVLAILAWGGIYSGKAQIQTQSTQRQREIAVLLKSVS